ncbi:MAG: hypothetical protein AAF623_19815 [Planctomycetota bacterium]
MDIPQWMFDSSVCALMRVQEHPRVSLAALKSLATLILEVNSVGDSMTVVEGTHFQTLIGDASHAATTPATKPPIPNPAVHEPPQCSSLVRSAVSGEKGTSK